LLRALIAFKKELKNTFFWQLGQGPGSLVCPTSAPSITPCNDCLCAGWQRKGKGYVRLPGQCLRSSGGR